MARNKMESFPLDTANPKSIKLHVSVKELHKTLLKVLPVLIDKLVPGTFRQCPAHSIAGSDADRLCRPSD